MDAALAHCLGAAPRAAATIDSVVQWQALWRAAAAAQASPFGRAVVAGFAADRVGWAFASGYQAALRALVPGQLADDAVAALCVTEEGGNRPRDIETTFTPLPGGGFAVAGAKRWTTLGPAGTLLLVAGREAGDGVDGRPRLRVARVPASTPGVAITPMPPTRFVPEVPHARVTFDDARLGADALLPGDGYARYIKPFRTLEDTLVTAAVLAYLLREAHGRDWPQALRERIVAALQVLSGVSEGPVDGPENHVLLAGALRWAHALYAEADALWAAGAADDEAARRWQRDAALFQVAAAAREARAARAWERLAASAEREGAST